MPYKHLFFDLDHTLWDFEKNSEETLRQLFRIHNLSERIEDFDGFYQLYSAHNKRLWQRYHLGHIRQEELRWKRMWHTLLDYKILDEQLAKQLSSQYLEILPTCTSLFPYTHEILTYLSGKGYVMHLITNGFEEVQWRKLQSSGIGKYFNDVITSELAGCLKPDKAIFDFAIQRAKCCFEESLMLGDNLDADIQGAINAGMDCVFINHTNEPVTLEPTYTIYHLKELEDIL